MKNKLVVLPVIAWVLIQIISMSVHAEWFCDTQSSERNGDQITTCGIGKSESEQDARNEAFDAAKNEFNKLCKSDAECRNKDAVITPKRTECTKSGESYKCVRALSFQIVERPKDDIKSNPATEDKHEFVLKKGMTKKEVFEILGNPLDAEDTLWSYKGEYCVNKYSLCFVSFEKGKITSTDSFKAKHTDLLAD